MNEKELYELMDDAIEGTISEADFLRLEAEMIVHPAARQAYLDRVALCQALAQEAREVPRSLPDEQSRVGRFIHWITWRPLTAAAAGLALGIFSASLLLAAASPKTTAERLFSLVNGSFDEARVGRGFPQQTGFWSGDDAAIADGKLRFIATESDAADPGGRAIACDVFQLVDLRPLKAAPRSRGDTVLELSANFLDARPPDTKPSVTFFCQLYLFQGDPTQMHQTWPRSIPDALASGSAQVTTLGMDATGARTLTARCLLPAEADFAVAQIVARPNLRPAKLDGLFADDVQLTLKTAPELPLRIVQR